MNDAHHNLPWLEPGDPFPPVATAWGAFSPAPGLVCAGADLSVATLRQAYSRGLFPWFSEDQPTLWWSPDPRMVLPVAKFRVHPSLRKTIKKFAKTNGCEIRIDTAFKEVITACATSPRGGQLGTWIVPKMIEAYLRLHHAGHAHSVETWVNGQLVGGLYGVNMGGAVFGESMFHRVTDGSKMALAALVALCKRDQVPFIDCQQNTRHLASMGAHEIPRSQFMAEVVTLVNRPCPQWTFSPDDWAALDFLANA